MARTNVYHTKTNCTGCGACAQVCTARAIAIRRDHEGFLYPQINADVCIGCNLCVKTCHMQYRIRRSNVSPDVYAACLKQFDELERVSSGGVFWALAQSVIRQGGVVYGVIQPSLFDVHHSRAETIDACKPFRRSKYLQSDTGSTYSRIKEDLVAKRTVLFTGTGCQVGGLYRFLGSSPQSTLVTCEVVCHGVPSFHVFERYIREVERINGKSVQNINYRDKSKGWKQNAIRLTFSDGSSKVGPSGKNPMHSGYLMGLYNRPSCASCQYAKLPRVADITLADFWRYQGALDSKMGISLVLCSTKTGMEILSTAREFLSIEESSLESAINSCYHLTHPPVESKFRGRFFTSYQKKGFHFTYIKCKVKHKIQAITRRRK